MDKNGGENDMTLSYSLPLGGSVSQKEEFCPGDSSRWGRNQWSWCMQHVTPWPWALWCVSVLFTRNWVRQRLIPAVYSWYYQLNVCCDWIWIILKLIITLNIKEIYFNEHLLPNLFFKPNVLSPLSRLWEHQWFLFTIRGQLRDESLLVDVSLTSFLSFALHDCKTATVGLSFAGRLF